MVKLYGSVDTLLLLLSLILLLFVVRFIHVLSKRIYTTSRAQPRLTERDKEEVDDDDVMESVKCDVWMRIAHIHIVPVPIPEPHVHTLPHAIKSPSSNSIIVCCDPHAMDNAAQGNEVNITGK